MKNNLLWYAVLAELKPELILSSRDEFGINKKTGNLVRVDLSAKGKIYSVCFKCGTALKELAKEKAEKFGGIVVPVNSEYMFNISDIDLNSLEAIS